MTIQANPSPPYVYQEFPKWKFHPDLTKEPQLVNNFEEEKALGSDWYDSSEEAQKAFDKLKKQTVTAKSQ